MKLQNRRKLHAISRKNIHLIIIVTSKKYLYDEKILLCSTKVFPYYVFVYTDKNNFKTCD